MATIEMKIKEKYFTIDFEWNCSTNFSFKQQTKSKHAELVCAEIQQLCFEIGKQVDKQRYVRQQDLKDLEN